METVETIHLIAYYLGIFIVFSTHAYMLVYPHSMKDGHLAHAIVNLLAAALIAYYFLWKEKKITL